MDKVTSGQRLKELMKIKNLSQADICKKCKIPKSSFSMYINDERKFKQDRLTSIALAYNVSEAWLMGFDVPMKREYNENEKEDYRKNPIIVELVETYEGLSEDAKKRLTSYMKFLSSEDKKQ